MSRRYNRFLFRYDRDDEVTIITEQRQFLDENLSILTIIPTIFFTRRLNNVNKVGIRPQTLRFMRICRQEGNFTTINPFLPGTDDFKTFTSELASSAGQLPNNPSYFYRGEVNNGSA